MSGPLPSSPGDQISYTWIISPFGTPLLHPEMPLRPFRTPLRHPETPQRPHIVSPRLPGAPCDPMRCVSGDPWKPIKLLLDLYWNFPETLCNSLKMIPSEIFWYPFEVPWDPLNYLRPIQALLRPTEALLGRSEASLRPPGASGNPVNGKLVWFEFRLQMKTFIMYWLVVILMKRNRLY